MAELIFTVGADTSEAASQLKSFLDNYAAGAKQAGASADAALGGSITKEVELTVVGENKVIEAGRKIGQLTSQQAAAQKALNGEMGKTKAELQLQLQGLQKAARNTQVFETNTRKVTKEFRNVTSTIKKVSAAIEGINKAGGGGLANMARNFFDIQVKANLATTAIQLGAKALGSLIKEGLQMETLQLQLEAFTGSAEAADAAMTEFVDIAVKTPFDVKQVAEAGKIMMGFGVSADQAVESTKNLAVAASATKGELNNLARNLGQISSQGRAYTRDLTQFAIQGIPIWEKLSDVTGKSTIELKKLAEEGAIGFDTVNAAIANATQAGSEFFILAQKMEKTLVGQFEALVTEVQQFAGAVSDAITDFNQQTGLIDAAFSAARAAVKGIATLTVGLISNLETIIKLAAAVGTGFATWAAIAKAGAVIAFMKTLGEWHKKMIDLLKQRIALNTILTEVAGAKNWKVAIGKLLVAGGKLAAVTGASVIAYKALGAAFDGASAEAAILQSSHEKLAEVYEQEKQKLEELKGQYDNKTATLMSINSRLQAYHELLKSGQIDQKTYLEAVKGLKLELKGLAPAADEASLKMKAYKDSIKDLKAELETMKEQKLIDDRATEDAIAALNKVKEAEKARHEAVKEQIAAEKDLLKTKNDAYLQKMEDVKQAEQDRHKAVMAYLQKEMEKAKERHEANMRALKAERAELESHQSNEMANADRVLQKYEADHNRRMAMIAERYKALEKNLEKSSKIISTLEKEKAAISENTQYQDRYNKLKDELSGKEDDIFAKMKLQAAEAWARMEAEENARKEKQIQKQIEEEQEELAKNAAKLAEEKAKAEEDERKRYEDLIKKQRNFIQYLEQRHKDEMKEMDEKEQKEEDRAKEEQKRLKEEQEQEKQLHENIMRWLADQIKDQKRQFEAIMKHLEAKEKRADKASKSIIKGIDNEIKAEQEAKKARDRAYEDKEISIRKAIRAIEDEIDKAKEMNKTVGDGGPESIQKFEDAFKKMGLEIDKQIEATEELIAKAKTAATEINGIWENIQNVGKAINDYVKNMWDQATKGDNAVLDSARFAGGPVTGGSKYTVNELGQEAFLSASGKLSLINAPSFGTWRAPGSGTVIPAHLTKGLDIPSGGVKLNSSARANSARASSSVSSAMTAIRAGDSINNTISIQSDNVNKTASDMLVELTKIRHRRYRR